MTLMAKGHSKNRRIVFVVPPVSMEEVFGEMGDVGNVLPFNGIMLLAGLTRHLGYETYIIDSVALRLSKDQLLDRIRELQPHYIGFTATTLTVHKAGIMARLVKEQIPDIMVLLGGPHVSAEPAKTVLKYHDIDVAVVGEGEDTLIELLSFLDQERGDLEKVRGIAFVNDNGDAILTGQRPLIEDFDPYPLPAWDLLPSIKEHYWPSPNNMNRLPATCLVVTRGCPLGCTFCFNRCDPRNRRVRWFSVDKIMRMITEMVNSYGIREITFLDDNMLANRKMMKKLCQRLIDDRLDLTWSCLGSTNFCDEETFRLMKRAGCWQISWGIEHARQEILDVYKKGIKVESMVEALRMARKCGLYNRAFFMHGNFLETKETIEDNIKYLKRLPIQEFHVSYFEPLPGTQAYHEVEKYGTWLIDPEDWEQYALFDTPIFLPNGLTEDEVITSLRRMYKEFYLRPRVIWYYTFKMLRHPSTFVKLSRTALRFLNVFG